MEKKLVSVNEIAQLLKITKERVYLMVREGLLPAVHLGRQLRFDETKLLQWIEDGGREFDRGWKKYVRPK